MEYSAGSQLHLFDPDAALSALGVTRRQLVVWHRQGLLHFDPDTNPLQRWMYQEVAFLYHLMSVEPSVNALRKFVAPLRPPFTLDHGRHYFNFRRLDWERRYELSDLLSSGVLEQPGEAGDIARALIRQLASVGSRTEILKTLAVLRDVLPDDWLKDPLPDE